MNIVITSYSIHYTKLYDEDKNNYLWIGTYGSGINKFDKESNVFECFNANNNLPNNVIYGILNNDDELWSYNFV